VWRFRHHSISDGAAAGDLATAEPDPERQGASRLSDDGRWWWDGQLWQPGLTSDGLWRWDGSAWQPTISLDGTRPADLAATLVLLAEDRYALAAAVLVERAGEWQPQAELKQLIHRAAGLRWQLWRVEQALDLPRRSSGLRGLVHRLVSRPTGGRPPLEERGALDAEHRSLMVRIGRSAPRPTLKDADDHLHVARRLDGQGRALMDGLAAMDVAERERAAAEYAAWRALAAAEDARRAAIEAAERRLADIQGERGSAVREARAQLRAALAPAPATVLAQAGPLRLTDAGLETPAGRVPAAGLSVAAGSAVTLWREHRDVLLDVLLGEAGDADEFLRCLGERRRDGFLLVAGRHHAAVWRCPPGEERAAKRFAGAIETGARRAEAAAAGDGESQVRAVAAAVARCRPSPALTGARAEVARVRDDPELLRAIQDARARLEAVRAGTPELTAATSHLAYLVESVTTRPRPLVAHTINA
jgi:hypothetical protein